MKRTQKSSLKYLIIIMVFLISCYKIQAQNYSTALGLRLGGPSGITLKHFTGANVALEGIFAFHNRGFSITGLYERHTTAFDVERLNWYYGIGGYFGIYKDGWWPHRRYWYDYPYYAGPNIGVSGIIGIEYTISEIPFNISLDWKPSINLIPSIYGKLYDTALSVRYVF